MRYIAQQDNYSCGPAALANILKWAGFKVNCKEQKKLLKEITSCDSNGTWPSSLDKALRIMNSLLLKPIIIKRTKNLTKKELDRHLDSGGIALFANIRPKRLYRRGKKKEDSGHFSLVISKTPRTYTLVNETDYEFGKNRSTLRISRYRFNKLDVKEAERTIWLIKRNNKILQNLFGSV